MEGDFKAFDGALNDSHEPSAVFQFLKVFSNIDIPEKLFFGRESAGMGTSGQTEIVSEGEVVALNQQVVFQVIFYLLRLLLLLRLPLVFRLLLLERQKCHPFDLENSVPFDVADLLADLDHQQEMLCEDGEDAHQARTDYFLFGVGRDAGLQVWLGGYLPSWVMFRLVRSTLIWEEMPVREWSAVIQKNLG